MKKKEPNHLILLVLEDWKTVEFWFNISKEIEEIETIFTTQSFLCIFYTDVVLQFKRICKSMLDIV